MIANSYEQPDEYDYFINKRIDRTYISKSFPSTDFSDIEEPRLIRILSKVFDGEENFEFAEIKKEIVLRTTPSGRQEVKVVFYEDSRGIKHITIQRFSTESGKPHKHSFSFDGEEIEKLFNILKLVKYVELESNAKVRMDDSFLNEWLISEDEKRNYFIENLELVKEISQHHITKSDVVAFAYRKSQLELFENMLNDQGFFDSIKSEWRVRGDEAV